MGLRFAFLGNNESRHSTAFLEELIRLGADVVFVGSSTKTAMSSRKGMLTKVAFVAKNYTIDEVFQVLSRKWSSKSESTLANVCSGRGIPFVSAKSVNSREFVSRLGEANPDYLLVHSFSEILKTEILKVAGRGSFNFHNGRLPENRGATPIERAILLGDEEVTTTCHELTPEIDAGKVICSASRPWKTCRTWAGLEEVAVNATRDCLRVYFDLCQNDRLSITGELQTGGQYYPRTTAWEKYLCRLTVLFHLT